MNTSDRKKTAILGIQEAHDASAAIMINGEIVAAAQEERFSGLKGDYGYPAKSVAHCLSSAGISANDLDSVVLASHAWNPVLTKIKRNANFSVDDWVREQREYWKPRLFEGKQICYYDLFKDNHKWKYDNTYQMDHLLKGYMDKAEMEEMKKIRIQTVAMRLGVSLDKVKTVCHEDCHTFYAYFASPIRGEVLSLTAEGIGDYSNGTVSRFSENGRIELAHTMENHLGHIYQYITLLLGMKPSQHEYKVMGLAPYANEYETAKSFKIFEKILKIDGLNIIYDQKPSDLYFWFRDHLEGHRFDGIAGGLQKFLEEILCKWVSTCIESTELHNVIFSGGVAQNIKANKRISELDLVNDIYICPAAGDTSLSIGACYYAMWENIKNSGGNVNIIKPLNNIYLGPSFSNEQVEEILSRKKAFDRYDVRRNVTPSKIAKMLAEGLIIARCCGRMEFGLRALGNRSILADPRHTDTVRKINSQIKFRDFWMPFTPTILKEKENDYIVNPKGLKCPYMTMAFDSTELARKQIIAALHPADFTVRPQILEEHMNPGYYEIIKEFERITRVGALLNTSFNLHGYPIALGPEEAVFIMDNSELDGVLIEDFLLLRR